MTLVRPPEFSARITEDDGRAVVTVSGELDLSTAAELSGMLTPLLDRQPQAVTIDLRALNFIDSTGLTLLVRTSRRLRDHHGSLRLTEPTPAVRRVLHLVGLDLLLATEPG